MDSNTQIIGLDVDGYDVITNAIMDLVNCYPGLESGDEVRFSVLDLESGKALFPSSGAVITQEVISITDHVTQECSYAFSITCRSAGLTDSRRVATKEWLDQLGRWLEKQTITIGGIEYKIDDYPVLNDGREFRRFSRTSPAYMYTIQGNQAEDWTINITAYYHNEFDR